MQLLDMILCILTYGCSRQTQGILIDCEMKCVCFMRCDIINSGNILLK
jgi:hypothetical protein